MGISTVECRVGTLVWVQRKNGSWWPAKIVGPISTKAPTSIKLLGRGKEQATLDWYNLETSKHIKAFRCGEFDDCIERAESSQAYPSAKRVKYSHRDDAILCALELEKQELRKKHKIQGEEQIGVVCRAKRSKCVYLPAESNKVLERTFLHPQPLQVSHSVGLDYFSAQSDSSKIDSGKRERGEAVTQPSGSCDGQSGSTNCKAPANLSNFSDFPLEDRTATDGGVQVQKVKRKLKIRNLNRRPGGVTGGKSYNRPKIGTCDREDTEDHSRKEIHTRSLKYLVRKVNKRPHNSMETTLIDVDLVVQACYQGEHVPLVSLTSKFNGKAIIGHPIDVEASGDGSPENDNVAHKLFGNGRTTMHLPVWRTSRRTPVFYVEGPQSSTIKNESPLRASQNSGHSSLEAMENSSFPKQMLKNPKTRMLSFGSEQKDGVNAGTRATCVAVKFVFSKLLKAVGRLKPGESTPEV